MAARIRTGYGQIASHLRFCGVRPPHLVTVDASVSWLVTAHPADAEILDLLLLVNDPQVHKEDPMQNHNQHKTISPNTALSIVSNVADDSTLASANDGVYATKTFEHLFDDSAKVQAHDVQTPTETRPHLLTDTVLHGAVDTDPVEDWDPMNVAVSIAELTTSTAWDMRHSFAKPWLRAGLARMVARLTSTLLAPVLHHACPDDWEMLVRVACGDLPDPDVNAFLDTVEDTVWEWAQCLPDTEEWASSPGGVLEDAANLSCPLWEHADGMVVADLIDLNPPEASERCAHDTTVARVFKEYRSLFGPRFAGVRYLPMNDLSFACWYPEPGRALPLTGGLAIDGGDA
jgi:hypothetical protein